MFSFVSEMPPKRKVKKKKDTASKRGDAPHVEDESSVVQEPVAKRSNVLFALACSKYYMCCAFLRFKTAWS